MCSSFESRILIVTIPQGPKRQAGRTELAALEEHLFVGPDCVQRAEEAANCVDAIRADPIMGNFDLQ
jgi:hypothetical protein